MEAPQSAYQKAFYPRHKASKESIQWLEYVAKHWKIPIAHAMSGHGGERWIENRPVDGYNHEKSGSSTVSRMLLARMSKMFP